MGNVKLQLAKVPEDLWQDVKIWKVRHPKYKNLSEVVVHFLRLGLKVKE